MKNCTECQNLNVGFFVLSLPEAQEVRDGHENSGIVPIFRKRGHLTDREFIARQRKRMDRGRFVMSSLIAFTSTMTFLEVYSIFGNFWTRAILSVMITFPLCWLFGIWDQKKGTWPQEAEFETKVNPYFVRLENDVKAIREAMK